MAKIVFGPLEQWIAREYIAGRSTYEICEELAKRGEGRWYANKINRLLRRAGIPIRNRSAAQAANLRSGRTRHPTKGTQRSNVTKAKISQGVADTYQNDPEAKLLRSKQSKAKYEAMTPAARENLRSISAKALRAAASEGSRTEKYVANELRRMGFTLVMHSKDLIIDNSLHVDIFIRELRTCVEIDGLSHVQPVWGQEALERTQYADAIKNGLILSHYNLVRLEAFARKFTPAYGRRVWGRLLPVIKMLREKQGSLLPMEDRFIYIKEEESCNG